MLNSQGSLNRLGANLRNPYGPSAASLNLDFTASNTLDSRITFSRGSQATLFDSTGTLVYAKHNLALQSEDFATTWTVTGATVSTNAATAPNGTATADKLAENSSTGSHLVSQNITYGVGTYTASLFAKKAERDWVRVLFFDGTNTFSAFFNLNTGVVGTVTGTGASAAIQSVGDGWYRCLVTAATAAGAGTFAPRVALADNNSSYTGSTGSGIFIWGAQLNLAGMEGGVTSSLATYYPTTTAAYYAPRFDYNPTTLAPQGLLIEEQRTNSIRNNTMVGAVAGTPGTLPTNWTVPNPANLTTNVVAFGVINGINYIDLQITGTTNATAYVLTWEATTQIAASSGQTWASSWWWSIIGGDFTNVTAAFMDIRELDGAGSQLASGAVSVSLPTSAFNRVSATRTNSIASTAYIQPRIRFVVNNTAAVNFTLRIGLPQLELGAFATSVIPTTTTALTRNTDVAIMTGTNFSSWYNASEGTLYADFVLRQTNAASAQMLASINDNSPNNRFTLTVAASSNLFLALRNTSGAGLLQTSTANAAIIGSNKGALAISTGASIVGNGGTVATNASYAAPVVTQIQIGNQLGAGYFNGTIQRIAYYPTRLANTTLQALTG
jgi:hypothetical protein